jgi:hypothetical protein
MKNAAQSILILGLLISVRSAYPAEIVGASSVEWLTVASTVVAAGTITDVKRSKGPHAVVYDSFTFEPSEVIKGEKSGPIKFIVRSLHPEQTFAVGDEVIVFLSHGVPDGREDILRDALVPSTDQFPRSVAKVTAPLKYFYDLDFRVLTTKAGILAVARTTARKQTEYLKNHPHSSIKRFYLHTPMGKETFEITSGGFLLFVPNFMAPTSREKLF